MTPALQLPTRWIHRASGTLLVVGAVALLGMILLSAGDVIYRNAAGVGVPGSIQINEMFMVTMTFGALAATQMHGGHVSVDLATARLSPRVAGIVQAVGLVAVAIVTAWAAWASWHTAIDAWRSAEVSIGIVDMPTWPPRFLLSLGLVALTAEISLSAVQLALGQREVGHGTLDDLTGGGA